MIPVLLIVMVITFYIVTIYVMKYQSSMERQPHEMERIHKVAQSIKH